MEGWEGEFSRIQPGQGWGEAVSQSAAERTHLGPLGKRWCFLVLCQNTTWPKASLGFKLLSPKEEDLICLKVTWMGSWGWRFIGKEAAIYRQSKAMVVCDLTRILISSQKTLMLIKKGPT